jgi:nickel-dependent lactate racemase
MAGCDFIVNVVIDAKRRVLRVVAGEMVTAHLAGVDFARKPITATLDQPADIVVTSSAGYPLDTTFYQCVKGMVSALPIVKRGGTIILAASMSEGIGSPEFRQVFDENPTLEGFMDRILHHNYFVMDQWQVEELAKAKRWAKIKVFSEGLPAETLRQLHVEPVRSIEAAVAESLQELGPDATIAVIPKGPYVLAELRH